MKAIELIKELQKMNPESEVIIEFRNGQPVISEEKDGTPGEYDVIRTRKHTSVRSCSYFWDKIRQHLPDDNAFELKLQELYDSMGSDNNEVGLLQKGIL